eukprot:SAG22_NODE_577_length_8975_cov_12.406827_12_plen_114_part_00
MHQFCIPEPLDQASASEGLPTNPLGVVNLVIYCVVLPFFLFQSVLKSKGHREQNLRLSSVNVRELFEELDDDANGSLEENEIAQLVKEKRRAGRNNSEGPAKTAGNPRRMASP